MGAGGRRSPGSVEWRCMALTPFQSGLCGAGVLTAPLPTPFYSTAAVQKCPGYLTGAAPRQPEGQPARPGGVGAAAGGGGVPEAAADRPAAGGRVHQGGGAAAGDV